KYNPMIARSGDEALDILGREPIDCVVLDLEMPGTNGFDVLRGLRQLGIDTPVIVYTGAGSYDRCIQAVRLGAYGFVDKAEPIERVVQEIENAVSRGRMAKELRSLKSRLDSGSSLIGDSVPMRTLRAAIARVAPIPSGVLIIGESGSGKELVARELHRLGPGASAPLIAVNSAALPEQLVESELFGHERGAFTGADRLRQGAFETAGDGTLFLDEIGELQLSVQAKLLRVLENRQLTRLAEYDWRKNNVRELRNCLERMMIASDADVIEAFDVPPEIRGEDRDEASAPGALKALKAQAERQIVLAALEKHDWQITRTA